MSIIWTLTGIVWMIVAVFNFTSGSSMLLVTTNIVAGGSSIILALVVGSSRN